MVIYVFRHFWSNTDDKDLIKFLKMFTDNNVSEIENKKDKDINDLKTLLANEATTLLHGKAAAIKASETAKKTFAGGSGDELPVIQIKKDQVNNGLNIIDLSIKTNLFSSKSEIRRTIKNSGLKMNNSTVTDESLIINVSHFENEVLKLSHGKKKHVLIKIIG